MADNSAVIKFGADYESVTKAIKDINRQMRTLRGESRDLNSALRLKMDPSLMLRQFQNAEQQSDLLKEKLEALNKAKETLQKSGAEDDSKAMKQNSLQIQAVTSKLQNQQLITQALKSKYDDLTSAAKQAADQQSEQLEKERQEFQNARNGLDQQIASLGRVSSAMRSAFRDSDDISYLNRSLNASQEQLNQINAKLGLLKRRADSLKEEGGDNQELASVNRQIAETSARYTEQFQAVRRLTHEIAQLNVERAQPAPREEFNMDGISRFNAGVSRVVDRIRSLRSSISSALPGFDRLRIGSINATGGFERLRASTVALGNILSNSLQTGVYSATSALTGLVKSSTQAADGVSHFRSTMQLGGFNNQAITDAYNQSKKYADLTVYNTNDIVNTTAKLASAGIPAYEQTAEALGNLNAALGGTSDSFTLASTQLVQIATRGKLTTEDFRTMTEDLGGGSKQLQDQLQKDGAFTGNFSDALQQGQISAQEFTKALREVGMQNFAKQAATSATTYSAAVGVLGATVQTFGQNVAQAMQKSAVGGINNFNNSVDKMLKTVQGPFISYLRQTLQLLQSPISGSGQTPMTAALKGIRQTATGLAPYLTVAIVLISRLQGWLVTPVGSTGSSPIQLALSGIYQIGLIFAPVVQAVGSAINQLLVTLTAPTIGNTSPLQLILSSIGQILQALTPYIPQVTLAITSLLMAIVQPIPGGTVSPLQLATQGIIDVIEGFASIASRGIQWISNLWRSLATSPKTRVAINDIMKGINSVIDAFRSAVPYAIQAVKVLITSLTQPIAKGGKSPLELVLDALASVIRALAPALPTLARGLVAIITPIASFIAKNPQSVPIVFTLMALSHLAAPIGGLVISVANFYGAIQKLRQITWLVTLLGRLRSAFALLSGPVGIVIAVIGAVILAYARCRKATQDLFKGFREYYRGIGQIISSVVVYVAGFARALNDLAHGHPMKAIRDFATGFVGALRQIQRGIRNMNHGIDDMVVSMREAGVNAIRGLWAGISKMGDWLKRRVHDFVIDTIPHSVRKALDIHSPSRVMAGIGAFIPAGLAAGITSASDQVEAATSSMVNRVTRTAQGSDPLESLRSRLSRGLPDMSLGGLTSLPSQVSPVVKSLGTLAAAFNGFSASIVGANRAVANFNQNISVSVSARKSYNGGLSQSDVERSVETVLRRNNLL